MPAQGGTKIGLLPALAGLLIAWGIVNLVGNRSEAAATTCEAGDANCTVADLHAAVEPDGPPVLRSETACVNVGYLCADLDAQERIQLRRWKGFSGTVVVHVPRPDFEDSGDAVRLQQAAARGLQVWNGQPFPILIDLQGDRNPHFAVRWCHKLLIKGLSTRPTTCPAWSSSHSPT